MLSRRLCICETMENFTKLSGLWEDSSYDVLSAPFVSTVTSTSSHNQADEEKNENIQDRQSDSQTTGNSTSEESDEKNKYKQTKFPLLPPCRVCGDQATGFHYGATTCEACKGFFRRSLIRKKEYTCLKGTHDCDVMAPKKAPCPGCRYQRCLAAGMSKKGIKRGRYSLVRKTNHIMEVKGLQSTDLSPAPSKQSLSTVSDVTVQPSTSATVAPPSDFSRNFNNVTRATAFEEFRKRKSLADALCQSYAKYCRFPDHLLNNLTKIQEDYAKQKRDQLEFVGPLELVDAKTFLELYKSTGIDVDYRIAYFRQRLANIELSICNLVSFAKSIPGFRSIVLEDQMTLVKSVQFHWWFLCTYPGICNETMIYTSANGDSVFKQEMQRFTGEEYAGMVFSMGELFSSLELDETEMALVIALSVLSSDFAVQDLHDFASIDALHQQIGEALYFYTKSNKDSSRFGHIISALTALRSAEGHHIEGRNRAWKIFEEIQFAIDVPPLVMELWAGMIPAVDPERVMQAMSSKSQNQVDEQMQLAITQL